MRGRVIELAQKGLEYRSGSGSIWARSTIRVNCLINCLKQVSFDLAQNSGQNSGQKGLDVLLKIRVKKGSMYCSNKATPQKSH